MQLYHFDIDVDRESHWDDVGTELAHDEAAGRDLVGTR